MKTLRKAENFRLKDNNGNIFDLYENLDMNVLLVFYPKNDSLVCSRQLKDYSSKKALFDKNSIKIAAVNDALPEEHSSFCGSKGIDLIILSDPDLAVAKQFSALYPFNFLKRRLILINRSGDVVFEKTLSPYRYWNSDHIVDYLAKNEFI
jgi:thioredoxin-dependent peroxiredoxin